MTKDRAVLPKGVKLYKFTRDNEATQIVTAPNDKAAEKIAKALGDVKYIQRLSRKQEILYTAGIKEAFFVDTIVSFFDKGDLNKIKKLGKVENMIKHFKSLSREKKVDLQRVLFRKYHQITDPTLKQFADLVIKKYQVK